MSSESLLLELLGLVTFFGTAAVTFGAGFVGVSSSDESEDESAFFLLAEAADAGTTAGLAVDRGAEATHRKCA